MQSFAGDVAPVYHLKPSNQFYDHASSKNREINFKLDTINKWELIFLKSHLLIITIVVISSYYSPVRRSTSIGKVEEKHTFR